MIADSATHDLRAHALDLARKLLRLDPNFMLESPEAVSFLMGILFSNKKEGRVSRGECRGESEGSERGGVGNLYRFK